MTLSSELTGMPASAGAEGWLTRGKKYESAGRTWEAMECFAMAVDSAKEPAHRRLLSEALRRLGVLHHLRAEAEISEELCERSYNEAVGAGAKDLAAEALNALAGFDLERGRLDCARERYEQALGWAGTDVALVGKIEQNLGVLASVLGAWEESLRHYERSLGACLEAGDRLGCATGYHNMGRVLADQKHWPEAEWWFRAGLHLAEEVADSRLIGLGLLSQAEVHFALGRHDQARDAAEAALRAFAALDARRDRAGAHRILGMIYREANRPSLAESHLRAALESAVSAACPLEEADSARELAQLYKRQGRREDSLELLSRARTLFARIHAVHEVADVNERMLEMPAACA